ncbi:TIGR04104 family putative zinc finger protein [Jeotgalibacillus campisalis]|uniref:TIGR04104 family putative zinc finger protein n=1 Tax=Jeotgalibacillus campisalis TaxID=220754 RepID=UPI000A04F7D5
MQKCTTCEKRFQWWQIARSLFILYRPIICSFCSTEHQITLSSRLLCVVLLIVPLYVYPYYASPFTLLPTVLTMLTMATGIFLILPYLVMYRATAESDDI